MSSHFESGWQATMAAALLDPDLPCPANLKAVDGVDLESRFAIYRNNVTRSLIDALADSFPVVQALVGDAFFRAMASVFVRQSPPTSRVLAFYGERFPDFIEAFEPVYSVPYLADVARLEMARVQAYHAPDVVTLDSDRVSAFLTNGMNVERFRFEFHPSVRIIKSPYAVVSIWAAHQSDSDADLRSIVMQQREAAMVCRHDLDAVVVPIEVSAVLFINALKNGHELGAAASIAFAAQPDLNVSATMSVLFTYGALTAIVAPAGSRK